MEETNLTPQITQGANDPASVTSDGMTVSAKPVDQLIKADQYLNNRAAIAQRRRGLYFNKLLTPGAFNGCGGPGRFNGPCFGGC